MSASKVGARPLLRAEVLDRYVEFLTARCRPNTVIATRSDLRAFFAVIDKSPVEVTTKDVFEFIAAQRRGRRDGATPGCWLAGRRMVAIDGTCLDVADTSANDSFFGRPGVMKGERSAFSQARVVALAECGTHAMFDAVVDKYTTSEVELSRQLVARLQPGMLCLADRGFYSFATWSQGAATGADLLWRVKNNLGLEPVDDLADGSWLAHVFDSGSDRKRQHPTTVRVVEYTIDDGREPAGPIRLITTITDPAQATAVELAGAYAQRWEIESAFDELKTHQRGPRTVLRSKKPDLVLQEIWGHLCCHYAIRALMFDAAIEAGRDPDRISFVAALRISRSQPLSLRLRQVINSRRRIP